MKSKNTTVVLGIAFLFLCGCETEASPPQPLILAIEGDAVSKAAIEEVIRTNPNILIPRSSTEYSMKIIEPDPNIKYHILRIEPDPDIEYSMIIIDPTTQKPPTTIDPNALKAIIDELNKRRQESIEK